MAFLFEATQSPVTVRKALKHSKTLRGARAVLIEDRRVTIYLACGQEDSPKYFRPGDRDAILFFGVTHCETHCHFGLYKILQRWMRTPGWLGWMLCTSRHLIVVDCRECTNKLVHYSKMSCVGVRFAIAGSISKHQGYQVMHSLLLSRMLAKATVNLSTYIANISVQWPWSLHALNHRSVLISFCTLPIMFTHSVLYYVVSFTVRLQHCCWNEMGVDGTLSWPFAIIYRVGQWSK